MSLGDEKYLLLMTKIANVFNSIGGTLKRKRIPYADRGVIITCTAS